VTKRKKERKKKKRRIPEKSGNGGKFVPFFMRKKNKKREARNQQQLNNQPNKMAMLPQTRRCPRCSDTTTCFKLPCSHYWCQNCLVEIFQSKAKVPGVKITCGLKLENGGKGRKKKKKNRVSFLFS
jgi:hypothetical protein